MVAYWYGKQQALALGSGPAWGMDANMVLVCALLWRQSGCSTTSTRRSISMCSRSSTARCPRNRWAGSAAHRKSGRFEGLKIPHGRLAVDIFKGHGCCGKSAAGRGNRASALDRSLLDAAEFNNATSDRILGFPDVSKHCMLQSYHQASENFEIIFNKTKYNSLAPELKA